MKTAKPVSLKVKTAVVISDTHFGCKLALAGKDPVPLDDGGTYSPSKGQIWLADRWLEFWNEFVPEWIPAGEPYVLVHNGDLIEGVHHRATTPISQNLLDQRRLAEGIMRPVVQAAGGLYYQIRGTEAHVGQSACEEEQLARDLGAIPNREGQFARYELWLRLGEKSLIHFLHHVGTTSSAQHEASAVNAELSAEFNEAARWSYRPPNIIVRSHRHRAIEIVLPSFAGESRAVVTPAWQLKTPFAWRQAGARLAPPQIGGCIIREGDRGLFTVMWTKVPEPSRAEIPKVA
jgi:hypothetical protein